MKSTYLPAVFSGVLIPALLSAFVPVAHAEEDVLTTVNTAVNHGIVYLGYSGWDFRDVGAGGYGNCAAIAYTKWKRLQEEGYGDRAVIRTCTLATGVSHAFVVVDQTTILNNNADAPGKVTTADPCVGTHTDVRNASLRKWVSTHTDRGPLPQAAKDALAVWGSGQ